MGVRLLVLAGIQLAAGLTLARYVPGQNGTYAQNYQDTWVVSLAKRNGWTSSGFFLDLGAYKGEQCSNTALLERSFGWGGICVEPFPVGFEGRSCMLASRALSETGGRQVQFGGTGQGRTMSLSRQPAVTITIQQLLACAVRNATAAPVGSDCTNVGQMAVPHFINFVSMDIEGAELGVLNGFPWDKFQVGAWVIENDSSRGFAAQAAVRKVLSQHGYVHAPVQNPGVDEYFVLPQFWDPSLAQKAFRVHPPGSGGC